MTGPIILCLTLAVFTAGGLGFYFTLRHRKERPGATFLTRQGLAVFGEPPSRQALEDAVGEVMGWWSQRYPKQAQDVAARIAQCSLMLITSPEAPRVQGRQVWGWTSGKVSYAWNCSRLVSVVHHEIGIHQCLYALGDHQAEEGQHERAKREGFPWL